MLFGMSFYRLIAALQVLIIDTLRYCVVDYILLNRFICFDVQLDVNSLT